MAAELSLIERDMVHVKTKLETQRVVVELAATPDSPTHEECGSPTREDGNSVPSYSPQDDHAPPTKRVLIDGSQLVVAEPPPVEMTDVRKQKLAQYLPELQSVYFLSQEDGTQRPPPSLHPTNHADLDRLDRFGKKLSQVTRENEFKVLGSFKLPDPINASNIISSIEFDATSKLFATAGVAKRIKVFNYDQLVGSEMGSPFPNQDIVHSAKISSLAWSPYIHQQVAAVDYDGVLSLYDVNTAQKASVFDEHQRRAWSLDYSQADPTRIVTGSDDHRVKVWSLNMQNSVCTIDAKSNVCTVQFAPNSSHLMAFGAADHNVHLYDLRNPARLLHVLQGHKKAVSYLRFMSETEIVSASTDCNLRLWKFDSDEASLSSKGGLPQPHCSRIFSGHVNEKNFVGFSVCGDMISCGSETNTVFAYHRDLSKPVSTYRFAPLCPRSGIEIESDTPTFISSLCWKKGTSRLLAGNSSGIIKLLELA